MTKKIWKKGKEGGEKGEEREGKGSEERGKKDIKASQRVGME